MSLLIAQIIGEKIGKKIIFENNKCVNSCSLVFDTFEYDSKCYKNCPNGTNRYINFDSENNLYIDCKLNSSFLVLMKLIIIK